MKLNESIQTGTLIGKYLVGKESPAESDQLKIWLEENSNNQDLFNDLKQEKNIATEIRKYEQYDKESAWEKYQNRITVVSLKKVMLRWKIAATFFFLISISGALTYLYKSGFLGASNNETYTTVTTTRGQNSKIILPDSSVVWVNSGTILSYNTNFAAKKRDIKLVGQAYFQIAKNKEIPLIVSCNDLKVKVLGTRFDVSAYPNDSHINVVLESGKVELSNINDKSLAYTMKPGEMAEYVPENQKLIIRNDYNNKLTSWKDGILVFKNDLMHEVFKRLERRYNIDVEVKDDKVNKLIFNATIVNENIEEVLELIKYSCAITYTITESRNPDIPRKVIIRSKN
jgi:ferric-dicitrate binding protein FerR (iron transport regulator)